MAGMIGRCLCGAVTVRVTDHAPKDAGACHCRMCQRWSGGLFLCVDAPAAAVQAEGPVTHYASSSFSERAFCATCGSHLYMRDLDEGAGYDLMPGLFDELKGMALTSEIYTDEAYAMVRLAGEHKRATAAEYRARRPRVEGAS